MRVLFSLFLVGCANSSLEGPELLTDDPDALSRITCDPMMSVFPVGDEHNIGYDNASCGSGTCSISCPDANANSDWGGRHHGIDIFAYQGAPLVAVADGVVQRVGTVSSTSGLRVRLRDACGWEYYYGHLDEAFVSAGQQVSAGQVIGTMGRTGTGSTHLHFNVSPDGAYSNDINPFPLLAATSATACSAAPPPPPPPPPSNPGPLGCGELDAGSALLVNEPLSSCDGRTSLVMQGDGNLALYGPSGVRWHAGTHGNAGATASFQGDGNLVVYTYGGFPLWHPNTHGNPDARLVVRDDGDLRIVSGSGSTLWRTQTGGLAPAPSNPTPPPSNPTPPPSTPTPPPPPPAANCGVRPGNSALDVNVPIASCDGRYQLVMQGDGNLVLYGPSGAVWNTVTQGNNGATAVFQGDGNLVVYGAWGAPLWHAGTHGNPDAELVVTDSGRVLVRGGSGNTLWSSAW